MQSHRHSTGLQGDAQRKPSKSAPRDGDWFFQQREAITLNASRQWDDSVGTIFGIQAKQRQDFAIVEVGADACGPALFAFATTEAAGRRFPSW